MNILKNKKRDFLITKKRHFYRLRSIAVNVLWLYVSCGLRKDEVNINFYFLAKAKRDFTTISAIA